MIQVRSYYGPDLSRRHFIDGPESAAPDVKISLRGVAKPATRLSAENALRLFLYVFHFSNNPADGSVDTLLRIAIGGTIYNQKPNLWDIDHHRSF